MKVLLVPASLFVLAGSTSEEVAYAPEEGLTLTRTFEARATFTLDEVSATIDGEELEAPTEFDYEFDSLERIVVTDEILEAEDGRPTDLLRTFDELLQETTYRNSEEETEVLSTSEMEGRTIRFYWDDEDEAYVVESDDGEDELEDDTLAFLLEDMDLRLALPDGEVEEGDEWSVDPAAYLTLMWPGGLLDFLDEGEAEKDPVSREMNEEVIENLDGEGSATLVEFREEDGARVAVISLELDVETWADSDVEPEDAPRRRSRSRSRARSRASSCGTSTPARSTGPASPPTPSWSARRRARSSSRTRRSSSWRARPSPARSSTPSRSTPRSSRRAPVTAMHLERITSALATLDPPPADPPAAAPGGRRAAVAMVLRPAMDSVEVLLMRRVERPGRPLVGAHQPAGRPRGARGRRAARGRRCARRSRRSGCDLDARRALPLGCLHPMLEVRKAEAGPADLARDAHRAVRVRAARRTIEPVAGDGGVRGLLVPARPGHLRDDRRRARGSSTPTRSWSCRAGTTRSP